MTALPDTRADRSADTAAETPRNRVVVLRTPREDHVDWLCRHVAANRFLPQPPAEKLFIGDGDFRAIGAEFLGHFIRLGGLKPEDRVLDVGCGIGRMAVPLTQYLTRSYDGVDVVEDGIRWCAETITPAYPAFDFHHLDVANSLYNPGGVVPGGAVSLPFEAGRFDFAILTSVVTHLRTAEVMRYAAELSRTLRPGGRVFLSLFLMNGEARAALKGGEGRYGFDPEARGPEFIADAANPNGAVAFDERFLLDLFATQDLTPARPVQYGHWSGRAAASNFQDLLVLRKEGA